MAPARPRDSSASGSSNGLTAQDLGGDRRGELPAKHLRSQIERVAEAEGRHRVTVLEERRHSRRGGGIHPPARLVADEEAIRAVHGRRAEKLAVDRDDPLALLAGRLRHDRLEPAAEALVRGVDREGELVPAGEGLRCERGSEENAGIHAGDAAAGLRHAPRPGQEPGEVDASEGRRHESESRERRIPPGDRGIDDENRPHVALGGEPLERRAGVRDDDEGLTRPATELPARVLEEEVEEHSRLERRPGIGRHDEDRAARVAASRRGLDHRGLDRVQDLERREVIGAEDVCEGGRSQARAPHSEEEDPIGARSQGAGEALELGEGRRLTLRQRQPSERALDPAAGHGLDLPECPVPGPDPVDGPLRLEARHRRPAAGGCPFRLEVHATLIDFSFSSIARRRLS